MNKVAFLWILIFLVVSCDKMAEIEVNSPSSHYDFDCGHVDVEVRSTKGIIYSMEQRYELNQEAVIYPRSLEVEYLDKNVEYSIWRTDSDSYFLNEENRINSDSIRLEGSSRLTLEFSLDRMASEGDIITIKANNFLKCEDEWVLTELIKLEVKEIH